MIYRFLSLCTDGACKKAKETSVIGEFVQSFMPPLCKGRGTTKWWKGFASVRSTLAGLAERGSETAQRLEGFASVRSTLAGLAERGSETAQRLEGCKKKQSLTAFGGAPFTQGSRKTLIFNQLRLCRTTSLCFSLLSFLSAPWFVMFTKNSGNLYCKTVENVV